MLDIQIAYVVYDGKSKGGYVPFKDLHMSGSLENEIIPFVFDPSLTIDTNSNIIKWNVSHLVFNTLVSSTVLVPLNHAYENIYNGMLMIHIDNWIIKPEHNRLMLVLYKRAIKYRFISHNITYEQYISFQKQLYRKKLIGYNMVLFWSEVDMKGITYLLNKDLISSINIIHFRETNKNIVF